MRVIFAGGGTGGHLYPGLSIARELVRLDPTVEPFFVGAQRGIEREVLPKSGFPHLLLDLHPLYRPAIWHNWKTILGAFRSWRRITRMVKEDPPALVVGTGGYAAGLMLAYAVVHRIPMVQQAGDSHPGITARLFARWSREIYLAFPEAAKVFGAGPADQHRMIDAGAPIVPPPVPRPGKGAAREQWGFPREGGRVLLIYGGSQGSLVINRAVADWVRKGIPDDLYIIWATGRGTYEEFKSLDSPRVKVKDYLSPIADAYAATDLALARAGAMTTAELFAWGIPAILIPLPTAAADHQTLNARALETAGAAIHLPQSRLTAEELAKTVTGVLDAPSRMKELADKSALRARPNSAHEIATRIHALLSS
ncbi:MAG TPA: UDP-N-acetylglucosamine--N-acetylmuramyl-(pentapeptide) pyrophosphoryl-undecaprenol N-acetylglucosamine transferase [Gemmatimonadaceae bacterium]|nr:UDP-N-acetylglucosamine--N-acetylmuramyl-(pentapeptide) pyrophosphoryl-undecaprenol N-acetylglucosamine transferase [Gemmatimonadaceae bacterium]